LHEGEGFSDLLDLDGCALGARSFGDRLGHLLGVAGVAVIYDDDLHSNFPPVWVEPS
jgi:hypothetical protein